MRLLKAFVKNASFGVSLLLILLAVGLAYIAIPAFGNKALIVRSGSMQPAIGVGDLVVVKTQKGLLSPLPNEALREGGNRYKEGDIVAFSSQKNPKLYTTHRIAGKEIKDGKVFYQTKGDANNAPDQNLIAEENVIGKSIVRLPYFGRLFAFAKSNVGFPLLVIVPALIVIILEMVKIYKEIKRQNRVIEVPAPKENFAGLKIIIPVFLSVMVMHNAFAYFSDTETSVGNIFAAAESFPSASPTPSPSPTPSEPFADDVTEVVGTFGHCCDTGNLSSDPAVAKPLVTGAPDSPPDTDFIQISDTSSVTLKFVDNKALPTGNGDPDIRVHTYDELFPASAEILVSQDCSSFTSLGIFPDTADVDLNIEATGYSFVKCVKFIDQVAVGDPYPTLGFDLDAVEALNSVPE